MALKLKKSTGTDEVDQSAKHEWPSPVKPSALLVPRYIIENNAAAGTRRLAILGVGGFAVVITLVVAAVFFMTLSATSALNESETARDAMQENVDRLGPIAAYYDGLDQRRNATVGLLVADIDHAGLLGALRSAMPAGASFASYAPVVGTPCPGPDPFTATESLGCITVAVKAPSQAHASTLVSNIQSDQGGILADPFVSDVSSGSGPTGTDGGGVSFTVSVNFTSKAYSGKYSMGETPETPETTGLPVMPGTPGASSAPETPTTDEGGAQ